MLISWAWGIWFILAYLGILAVERGFKFDLNKLLKDTSNPGSFIATGVIMILLILPSAAIAYAFIWTGGKIYDGWQLCKKKSWQAREA